MQIISIQRLQDFLLLTRPGIHMSVDTSGGILEFFEDFFDDDVQNVIVTESNHYAEQCL
jgi:hypothetical protein